MKFEDIKNQVRPVLLPIKENEKILQNLAWTAFGNVAVVYEIWNENAGDTKLIAARITRELLRSWGIAITELHLHAIRNLSQKGYSLFDLEEGLFALALGIDIKNAEKVESGLIYVLTTTDARMGAAMVLDRKVLSEIADGKNLYILLASIHDVLLCVDDESVNIRQLKEYASNIYNNLKRQKEHLSKDVFHYNASEKRLIRVTQIQYDGGGYERIAG